MGEITLTEDAFYWVAHEGAWRLAQYMCGDFYPCGSDYGVTPTRIVGPLVPPPNPEQSE